MHDLHLVGTDWLDAPHYLMAEVVGVRGAHILEPTGVLARMSVLDVYVDVVPRISAEYRLQKHEVHLVIPLIVSLTVARVIELLLVRYDHATEMKIVVEEVVEKIDVQRSVSRGGLRPLHLGLWLYAMLLLDLDQSLVDLPRFLFRAPYGPKCHGIG